ncbi:MAG TPA: mechanosensitive ion channel family protein, partial [Chloroflexota bacterium]|nr:mechanosensitive ion channel family protein [Chloroflexota bacterium]
ITAFLIAVTVRLMRRLGERLESFRPVEGMAKRVTQITLGILGGLLILNALTIPITPLLTTLGVAGLATALALQDTLSNFFAGFYLLADRPIRPGDFIKLDTGHEGYVLDVGWRTTKLRTLPNTVVVLPNSKLSQSIITNYSLPEGRMAASLKVSVAYDSDIDQVERVLKEIVENAKAEIPTLLADPPPGVAFSPGFGESSLDFTIGFQVDQYVDQFKVQNELRKKIFQRFRAEGIRFGFPMRTIQVVPNGEAGLPPRESAPPPRVPELQ